MKKIFCDVCGGSNIVKQNGKYVCQDCGISYTLEELKGLMGKSNNVDTSKALEDKEIKTQDDSFSIADKKKTRLEYDLYCWYNYYKKLDEQNENMIASYENDSNLRVPILELDDYDSIHDAFYSQIRTQLIQSSEFEETYNSCCKEKNLGNNDFSESISNFEQDLNKINKNRSYKHFLYKHSSTLKIFLFHLIIDIISFTVSFYLIDQQNFPLGIYAVPSIIAFINLILFGYHLYKIHKYPNRLLTLYSIIDTNNVPSKANTANVDDKDRFFNEIITINGKPSLEYIEELTQKNIREYYNAYSKSNNELNEYIYNEVGNSNEELRKELLNRLSIPYAYTDRTSILNLLILFVNKRASNLEDLINLYEREKFQDKVLLKLDTIISKLDYISNYLDSIERSIQQINTKIDVLGKAMIAMNQNLVNLNATIMATGESLANKLDKIESSIKDTANLKDKEFIALIAVNQALLSSINSITNRIEYSADSLKFLRPEYQWASKK